MRDFVRVDVSACLMGAFLLLTLPLNWLLSALAAAAFHELYLLLVHTEDSAVRVGVLAVSDDEAVRQRSDLQIVADTGHRAALRNDVTEMVEQRENLLLRERIRVFLLDAFDFGSDALVHLARRFLVDVSERVLEGVLADPHRGGEVVPVEILLRLGNRIVVIDLLRRVGFGGF